MHRKDKPECRWHHLRAGLLVCIALGGINPNQHNHPHCYVRCGATNTSGPHDRVAGCSGLRLNPASAGRGAGLPRFGKMSEWFKEGVCKTSGSAFGGSNPPLPISFPRRRVRSAITVPVAYGLPQGKTRLSQDGFAGLHSPGW